MAWDDLKGIDWPNRADLQDAVDKGYFLENNGVPTTDTTEFITKEQALDYVQINEDFIPIGFPNTDWLPVMYYTGLFPVVATEIDNLASPRKAVYNPTNGLIYYIDQDTPDGGVWYFNPLTAQSKNDIHVIPGTSTTETYSDIQSPSSIGLTDIVYYNNKIYVHGQWSSGMLIIDCSSNTVTSTIAYGSNDNYSRQQLTLLGTRIWAYSLYDASFIIIDTSTESQIGTFDLTQIPGWNSHNSSFISLINSKIWITLTSASGGAKSIIRIYNNVATPDYSTDLVGSINDIGNTAAYDSKIEITDILWDSTNSAVYLPSVGDKEIYVYDDSSYSLLNTIEVDSEGKSNIGLYGIYRQTTDQLYFSGTLFNDLSESGFQRTYELDRVNKTIANTLIGTQYSSLIYVNSTELNYATNPGILYVNNPNTGYDTDGKIIAFN